MPQSSLRNLDSKSSKFLQINKHFSFFKQKRFNQHFTQLREITSLWLHLPVRKFRKGETYTSHCRLVPHSNFSMRETTRVFSVIFPLLIDHPRQPGWANNQLLVEVRTVCAENAVNASLILVSYWHEQRIRFRSSRPILNIEE